MLKLCNVIIKFVSVVSALITTASKLFSKDSGRNFKKTCTFIIHIYMYARLNQWVYNQEPLLLTVGIIVPISIQLQV